jgi:hypothetical protein
MRCVHDGCESDAGQALMCLEHRSEAGRAFEAQHELTEVDVLDKLVFRFPAKCGTDEFVARLSFAASVWSSDKPVGRATRTFRVRNSSHVSHGSPVLEKSTMLEFVTRIAPSPSIKATCASCVVEWYPRLVEPAPIAKMIRAERVLGVMGITRFLRFADLARALGPVFPQDVIETVYRAYALRIQSTTGTHVRFASKF